jgi:lambda family phage portal protein
MSNWLDRVALAVSPSWGANRLKSRLLARHYEGAAPGRRTENWRRNAGDANANLTSGAIELRMHARDLARNNGYAQRALNVVTNNTIGWGVVPKATRSTPEVRAKAAELWDRWANTTECESEGRMTFAAIQRLAMRSVAESGEVLIRRRWRRAKDALSLPLQLQVLEADYLDSGRTGFTGPSGGPTIQGIEYDLLGRRTAYWLFSQHPGSTLILNNNATSRRVPAEDIAHVFLPERPGQSRGVSWLARAVVNMKDLDELDDAELVSAKIASCFAAFVTDTDGMGAAIGATEAAPNDLVETLTPGMIVPLPPGKQVTFGQPPATRPDTLSIRTLRRVAVGMGITYEDLSGDFSQVNFSSARMARIAHQGNVDSWREFMVIPQLCQPIWDWAMEGAVASGELPEAPGAKWTAPPLALIEPDKEGLSLQRLVRIGAMTPSEMVREQGHDPEAHWAEYAADMAMLDTLKLDLDSDVRRVSQAGLTQQRVGAQPKPVDTTPPSE